MRFSNFGDENAESKYMFGAFDSGDDLRVSSRWRDTAGKLRGEVEGSSTVVKGEAVPGASAGVVGEAAVPGELDERGGVSIRDIESGNGAPMCDSKDDEEPQSRERNGRAVFVSNLVL